MLHTLIKALYQLIVWFDMLLLTSVMYLFSWLPESIRHFFYLKLFYIWCRHFVRALNVDLKVAQHYQSPLPEQYILVANHPSAFEDIGIPAVFNVISLAKEGVRHWPIVGRISEAAGTLYVKRSDPESRKKAKQEILEKLSNGYNIALYPEGGCFGKRVQHKFHYGAFSASMQANIPLVPVFLHYEAQHDFEWRDGQTLVDKIIDFISTQNNRVTYHVYDAIDPEKFNDQQAYMQYTHDLFKQWEKQYLD